MEMETDSPIAVTYWNAERDMFELISVKAYDPNGVTIDICSHILNF